MLSLISVGDVLEKARQSFRSRRLTLGLTQQGLANRSGVTLATLRKFERTGKISFESFLHLALVLDCLENIANALDLSTIYKSIDEILQTTPTIRRRGHRT